MSGALDRLLGDAAACAAMLEEYGAPLHLIEIERLEAGIQSFRDVLDARYPKGTVAFAVKSNPCRGALAVCSSADIGADTASEYEYQAARGEGIAASRIVCNGNAKSVAYIDAALRDGARIAVDSGFELDLIEQRTVDLGTEAKLLVRVSGLPLSGYTNEDQSTASDWTKFGFPFAEVETTARRIAEAEGMTFEGLSIHIGTQVASPDAYHSMFGIILDLVERLNGADLPVRALDIGGGFPVNFMERPAWESFRDRIHAGERAAWSNLGEVARLLDAKGARDAKTWMGKDYWSPTPGAAMLEAMLGGEDQSGGPADRLRGLGEPELIIEPGRSLIGPAGATLTRVAGVKQHLEHPMVVLDMGVNNHGSNLISPDIFPVRVLPECENDSPVEAYLAGRLCFSGDMISKALVSLNRLPKPGELFVIDRAGAYCADHFASHSCGFPLPAKVALRGDGGRELWRAAGDFDSAFPAARTVS